MYLLVTGFYAFLSHLDYLYAAVAAYLCGCFNGALFTSRLFFHDDVRTHGSGNAGLTNFYRTYGARYAVLVIARSAAVSGRSGSIRGSKRAPSHAARLTAATALSISQAMTSSAYLAP